MRLSAHPRHAQVFARAGGGRSAFRTVANSSSRSSDSHDFLAATIFRRRAINATMSVVRKPSVFAPAVSVPLLIFHSARPPPRRARRQSRSEKRLFPSLFLSVSISRAARCISPSVCIYVRTPLCRRRRRSRHAATHSALPRNVWFHLDGRSSGRESTSSNLTFERPVAVIVDTVREKTFVFLDSVSTTIASTSFACQADPV